MQYNQIRVKQKAIKTMNYSCIYKRLNSFVISKLKKFYPCPRLSSNYDNHTEYRLQTHRHLFSYL